jgi:hypothetical protein
MNTTPAAATCLRGKKPGTVIGKGIVPADYAPFEDPLLTFDKGDHVRVCMKIKNWANSGPLRGTRKTFVYTVNYANP